MSLYTQLIFIYIVCNRNSAVVLHELMNSLKSNYSKLILFQNRVPFDKWFKVSPLEVYHRVITMEKFMTNIAPSIWPKGTRTGK